jgi:hypothetical protein
MNCIVLNTIQYPAVICNGITITWKSIGAFSRANSTKSDNDSQNKIRETIIAGIINGHIPNQYYGLPRWAAIKDGLFMAIDQMLLQDNRNPYQRLELKHKGGRKFNYDFDLFVYYNEGDDATCKKIEFKFNASTIAETPQFVSPMRPSQYLVNSMGDKSFEEEFYDDYLPAISAEAGLPIPLKHVYLKEVHGSEPRCMMAYKELYRRGSHLKNRDLLNPNAIFYDLCNQQSKACIRQFIEKADLDLTKLSAYLQETQRDKIYLLFSEGRFYTQTVNMDDYILCSVKKNPEKSRYECLSQSGKKVNVLLRWKNGNGIAFPAFQIS